MEIWGGTEGPPQFVEFVYKHVVPACFLAPLRETFDLNDAQATIALSESALCLKAIDDKRVSCAVYLLVDLHRAGSPMVNVTANHQIGPGSSPITDN